jgi:hypothetical protein
MHLFAAACCKPAANSHQMLTLKAAGHPQWYHPSSLTSGGRFANKSPAVLARQAAHGMLAAAWHLYTGGRPAECFRMRWDDSSVPEADAVPPVWVLGLAGVLQSFQDMPGIGFCLVSGWGWGCRCLISSTLKPSGITVRVQDLG